MLTSTSNLIRIVQPCRLNGSIPDGFGVIDKERGPKIPTVHLFEAGIWLISSWLAPEDFWGDIPSQAWSSGDIIMGVATTVQTGKMSWGNSLNGLLM